MKNFHIFPFAYISLLWAFLFLKVAYYIAQPQAEIDSLKVVLQQFEPGDSAYLMNQLFIGTNFFFLHQTDSAQHYIEEAWKRINPERFPELTIYALNRKGILADELGDYPSSIQYLKEGLSLSESHGIKKGIKSQYLALGRTYMHLEEWDMATGYYFKGLELAEELKHLEDQYIALHNLSIPFSFSGQPEQSLRYKRKSLNIPGYTPPPVRIIATYMGMADDFKDMAAFDSAAIYAEKALHIAKELNHIPFQARIYSVLTNNAVQREYFSQALAYSDTQADLIPYQDKAMKGSHLTNRAYALFGLKRYKEAFRVSHQALEIADSLDHLLLLNNAYFQLYNFHKELDQHPQALMFREKLRTVEDSLNVEGKKKELDRLQIVYDTRKKEKELEVLQRESQRQQLTLRNRTLGLWMMGGVLFLGFLGIFLFFRNRILQTQVQRNLTEQRLLRAQMNPYFFFHALSTLEKSILKGEDKQTSLHYLSRFARLMRNILECSRTEFIPLEEEIENLENYLELQRLRHNFSFVYEIGIDHHVDKENWGIPSMLLQPVVENAIEERLIPQNRSGKLSLDFHRAEGKLQITIEDNATLDRTAARDFSVSQLTKGTDLVHQRLALLKTHNYKQAGMEVQGLTNAHGSTIGTRVVVQLPVHQML